VGIAILIGLLLSLKKYKRTDIKSQIFDYGHDYVSPFLLMCRKHNDLLSFYFQYSRIEINYFLII